VFAGQRLDVDLEVGDDALLLSGRLFDGSGAPLVNETVQAQIRCTGLRSNTILATDPYGQFLAFIEVVKDGGVRLETLRFTRLADGTTMGVNVGPRTLLPGENSLGNLRFTAR
jgi:hypothetical protein